MSPLARRPVTPTRIIALRHYSDRLLGNTTAICRKCYVHPEIINAYMDGSLARTLSRRAGQEISRSLTKLRPEEAAVLALLKRRLSHEGKKAG